MVLRVRVPREDARPSIEEVAGALGGRPPGPEEIFGRQVLLDELRGKIGRDEDTNANLTRRMLLMLESVAICGDEVHGDARRALIAGYFEANVKDHRPPRFLPNDLVRYLADDCGRLREQDARSQGRALGASQRQAPALA
jgi:hypothetical protein